MVLTYNPRIYRVEAGRSEVQDYPLIRQKVPGHSEVHETHSVSKKACGGVMMQVPVIVLGEAGVLQAQCRDRKRSLEGQREGGKEHSSHCSFECSGV